MTDPNEKTNREHLGELEEKMGMNDQTDDPTPHDKALMEKKDQIDDMIEPDLDAIEERIDKMADDSDQEEPMTVDRKIHMLSKIFAFAIGDRIKNLLDEEGIIDLVGLDRRGVLYLVQYKENIIRWEAEDCITKIPSYLTSETNAKDPELKTDINEEALLTEKKKWERKYTGQHRVG